MMKIFTVGLAGLCLVLAAGCNDNGNASQPDAAAPATATTTEQNAAHQLPFRRDINETNAYSNLFLDSSRLEKFLDHEKIGADTAGDIRSFYNNRANQLAWFNDSGFTEQAMAFRSLYDYDKDSGTGRRMLDDQLDRLINKDSLAPSAGNPRILSTELMMSWRLVNYLDKKFPRDKRKYAALENLVPYEKKSADDWIKWFKESQVQIAEKNAWLQGLEQALDQLSAVEKKGGWDNLPVTPKKYRDKKNTGLIQRLKKRLVISGFLPATDTTATITPALKDAIKKAQAQYGFEHDTVLTANLLKELNVPVQQRIRQVIVNLLRMMWFPDMPDKDYILVNIPEFKLHVRKGEQSLFDMDIITGKEGHSTVVFSGKLNQVVFSPYWNLTDSIVKKEVLPHLEKDKHYLETQHMEQTGERNGLPVVRQLPGEWNELGKVKFLFPNSQQIYFHDTPHKWLFNKDQRAYSHGCIRLAEPRKLAQFLLKNNREWNDKAIDDAMNAEKERFVKLTEAVPVFIYYYTAWVDEAGVLQLRKDIYRHDADMEKRLF